MLALDQIYLRASVASVCNLTCVYCPKASGMEDRVPEYLQGTALSTDDYIRVLTKIAAVGVKRVSFTGGEPTLNRDLPRIIESADGHFDLIELTSNGLNVPKMMKHLSKHLDLLKISLDSASPAKFASITNSNTSSYHRAIEAAEVALAHDVSVGINCVLMRSSIGDIDRLIELTRKLNRKYSPKAYLSVLDFYFSPEKKSIWEREYLQIGELEMKLRTQYVHHQTEDRFGCRFEWFDADGVEVRIKDSAGPTMRASICDKCSHYCQEGIYGLKLSTVGWVTTCPVSDRKLGALIKPDMSVDEVRDVLAEQVNRIVTAKPDNSSFAKMLLTHGLQIHQD